MDCKDTKYIRGESIKGGKSEEKTKINKTKREILCELMEYYELGNMIDSILI